MPISTRQICALLLSTIVAWTVVPVTPAHAKPPLQTAIKRQQHRNEYTRFEAVVDALDITEGMTILDIGAGPGYASFLFAERLRGSGKVFATDIREDFVGYIADEAKRRGLANLSAAVVREDGLDEFYGKHRYDLVFLSNVYHCLDNRIEYFGKLRGFLNPGARLVLVLYNQVPLFSEDDLSDVDAVVRILSGQRGDDPFYRGLSPGTKEMLKATAGGRGERLKKALVEDFNRMLTDPGFFRNFYRGSNFEKNLFTAPERELANWLLMSLREDGVLDKPADQLDGKALRAVVKLNRLFFVKRFDACLAEHGLGAYVPAGDANRQTSRYVVLRELQAAGYRLVKEVKLSPYFDAVIMVPATP